MLKFLYLNNIHYDKSNSASDLWIEDKEIRFVYLVWEHREDEAVTPYSLNYFLSKQKITHVQIYAAHM